MVPGVMTYRQAVNLLSLFLRKGSEIDNYGSTPQGELFEAVKNKEGDFSGADFPCDNVSIANSIWHTKAVNPPIVKSPPAFPFELVMSSLGMLSNAIPVVGSVASAGIGVVQALSEKLGEQLAWWKKTAEVRNPSIDVFQDVADQIIGHMENKDINDAVSQLFADIISLQTALNSVLIDPCDVSTVGNCRIKVKPGLTKSFVLGEHQIGAVFSIDKSNGFKQIMNASSEWVNKDSSLNLYSNPSFATATLDAFMNASIVMVNAMTAYAFLYVLPEEAFTNADWDNSDFDIKHELANAGKDPIPGLPKTAWDALLLLEDRLAPKPPEQPNYRNRLNGRLDMWQHIYNRLRLVSFSNLGVYNREGIWFMPEDATIDVRVPAGDISGFPQHLLEVLTTQCVNKGLFQAVCLDTSLSSSNYDRFIEPYRGFNTKLQITWLMGNDPGTIMAYMLSGEAVTVGIGSLVVKLNGEFSEVTYPMKLGGTDSGPISAYNDVFWDLPESETELTEFNPKNTGFLSSSHARDVVAWLGMVLMNYCQQYRFSMDLDNDTNTFEMTDVVGQNFDAVQTMVQKLLGR